MLLLERQEQEAHGYGNPVDVVGDDRAVGGRVVPAEDGVEDTPAAAAVELGAAALEELVIRSPPRGDARRDAYIDVPNALSNVVRAWPEAQLGRVTANDIVPLLRLEEPDAAREEARSDEVKEAGRDDKKDLDLRQGTTPRR